MTPDEINALPERVRLYIHDIETQCDPAGMVAENTLLRDQVRALDAMIARLKSQLKRLTTAAKKCDRGCRRCNAFERYSILRQAIKDSDK